MTAFEQELLNEKITQCAQALADLQGYRNVGTLEYLRSHPDTYYAVCYRFIGVIEALFDIGQIVLAMHHVRATGGRAIYQFFSHARK